MRQRCEQEWSWAQAMTTWTSQWSDSSLSSRTVLSVGVRGGGGGGGGGRGYAFAANLRVDKLADFNDGVFFERSTNSSEREVFPVLLQYILFKVMPW